MVAVPATKEAIELFHESTLTLSEMEHNGFKIDVPYLKKAIKEVESDVINNRKKLQDSRIWRKWSARYGKKANIDSRKQLGVILHEVLDYPVKEWTAGGSGKRVPKTTEAALAHIDEPFIKTYFETQKLQKAHGTYLQGILDEVAEDGKVHCFFHLHLVDTFRSSSSNFNLQNQPKRNKRIAEIVRRCFISRWSKGRILEIDFKGAEVCTAACYNQDPVLIRYIKDKTKDMHRDMAIECYRLKNSSITPDELKKARDAAKNRFVFPAFYGSYYINTCQDLWDAIEDFNLTVGGKSMALHLAKVGIKELGACDIEQKPKAGTFEHHIQKVENNFWNDRFAVYNNWKRSWYERYLEKGYFRSKTGFVVKDPTLEKNKIINYPIQGSAFHCLLWCMNYIARQIRKKGLKSLIIFEIHDSLGIDVYPGELDTILAIVRKAQQKLVETWDWINVPMTLEAEAAPIGGSWFDKVGIAL